jgi:hypothetical protein
MSPGWKNFEPHAKEGRDGVTHPSRLPRRGLFCLAGFFPQMYNGRMPSQPSPLGRKKLRKPKAREMVLGVRLSAREWEMLQAVVDAEGVTASELVRRWLKTAHTRLV